MTLHALTCIIAGFQQTDTMTPAPAAALAHFATMSTVQLIEAFEGTEGNNAPEIPTVRGWLMDAMEARQPLAFLAWLEAETSEASPRRFFHV